MKSTLVLPSPHAEVFDFLARPAALATLAPPELGVQLVEGPARLVLGAVVQWQGRRMGITQSLVHEVTAFEEGVRIEQTQRQGPFRRWTLAQRFEAVDGGTRLTEELDYEPPGGMLGLLVGAAAIRKDLEKLFAYRQERLRERFGAR